MSSNDILTPYTGGLDESRFTGFDAAMQHDQRMIAEMEAQRNAGVPLGEIRASAPLRMPQIFDGVYNAVEALQEKRPAADFKPETRLNLAAVEAQLDESPPASATVVNFHPRLLRVNGGRSYYRHVPPCLPEMCLQPPGQQCAWMTIDDATIDPVPEVSGNYNFRVMPPLHLVQSYMTVANANDQLWGPGAFVYAGQLTPDQMWEDNPQIATFSDPGIPLFTEIDAIINSRKAGGAVRGKKKVPIMRSYRDVYMDMFERRNHAYLEIVTRMDSEWKQLDGNKKKNAGINSMTRDQAQVLLNLGLLLEPPEWLTPTRKNSGVSENKCSNCRANVKIDAMMCADCGWPVDVLEAAMRGKITIEHLAIDDLSAEQIAEVIKADAARKAKRERAMELATKPKKPEINKPTPETAKHK